VRELATRLAGSQDLFGARDRGPVASVNFVAAHDGFTVADLTAYNAKHNGPNGEGNRDGTDGNRSWNHGLEGPTDPLDLTHADLGTARRRSMRNLLATTLLATGVPMLNAGDELGRSQDGNNNPYCQDSEVSWFDWDLDDWQEDLLATTQFLTTLRAEHAVLRQRTFFTGRPVHEDGSTDLAWFGADGEPMENGRWEDPSTRTLLMFLNGAWLQDRSLLVVLRGDAEPGTVTLPALPGLTAYELLWDSTLERPCHPGEPLPPGPVEVGAACLQVYRAVDPT
jgi:glycogen operon protein